jgi:hypothetical protein
MVVPVLLGCNEDSRLWDYGIWLMAREQSRLSSPDFIYYEHNRRMHCVLLYCDQRDAPVSYRNGLLSGDLQLWLRNVLVVWANNDWPSATCRSSSGPADVSHSAVLASKLANAYQVLSLAGQMQLVCSSRQPSQSYARIVLYLEIRLDWAKPQTWTCIIHLEVQVRSYLGKQLTCSVHCAVVVVGPVALVPHSIDL